MKKQTHFVLNINSRPRLQKQLDDWLRPMLIGNYDDGGISLLSNRAREFGAARLSSSFEKGKNPRVSCRGQCSHCQISILILAMCLKPQYEHTYSQHRQHIHSHASWPFTLPTTPYTTMLDSDATDDDSYLSIVSSEYTSRTLGKIYILLQRSPPLGTNRVDTGRQCIHPQNSTWQVWLLGCNRPIKSNGAQRSRPSRQPMKSIQLANTLAHLCLPRNPSYTIHTAFNFTK